MRLVIAGSRPWNRGSFERWAGRHAHDLRFVDSRAALDAAGLSGFAPDYVFFVHWSWRIPAEIFDRFECIGFHMTDLPFGRGGSPLQNLIVRGITETRLSAFRVSAELDAGGIYLKRPLALDGSAQEIFERASDMSFAMIDEIVERRLQPVPQAGAPTFFERRRPEQSRLPESLSAPQLYDFIRMLDAEGYPRAFLQHGTLRFEFSAARLEADRVAAHVQVSQVTSTERQEQT